MLNFNTMYKDQQSKQDRTRQMRLTRVRFRRINSLDLIPEDPKQEELLAAQPDAIYCAMSTPNATATTTTTIETTEKPNFIVRFISFVLQILVRLIRCLLFIPLSVAAPSFWLSALLWMFWKLVRIPFSCIRWLFNYEAFITTATTNSNTRKRTILLSAGSSLQTLHLARNLYCSGARVIVFEYEGLFFLSRFSTAVDKFYVVPRPSKDNADNYIAALCHIVQREKPDVYVPVCASSSAYYDALAKPHLELLGCPSFIPGLQETSILDDCLKFFEKCAAHNITLPAHQVLSSTSDLLNSYDTGFISHFRNILIAVGKHGLYERQKYMLPANKNQLKFKQKLSEQQQWILLRDVPGEHFVTCTTIKESRVVANVSCRIEALTNNLLPIAKQSANDQLILNWLHAFFAKVRFQRQINTHISLRLVKCQSSGQLLPLGIQLGVSLPYISYNRAHAQILSSSFKCQHLQETQTSDRNLTDAAQQPEQLALDKREALFAYWDPLPYCAYYHFQLPLSSVKTFLQQRQQPHNTHSHLKNNTHAEHEHNKMRST